MKTIFFSLLITCFLFACSDNAGLIPGVNEGEAIEEGELIPVSFNMGFTKEVTPFRAGNDEEFTLNFTQKYLVHVIFKKNAEWNGYFFYKKYTIMDSDGSIKCELPEGEYTSLFIAYKSGIFYDYPQIVGMGNLKNFNWRVNTDEKGTIEGDQFYNETAYKVEKDAENSHPIILERIVGKVEIVFEDIIPKDVATISMGRSTRFTFLAGPLIGGDSPKGAGTFIISESDKSVPGYTLSFFAYEGNPDAYIILTTKGDPDSEDENLGSGHYLQVTISNVNIQKGKILRYKGKFFEGSEGFSLELFDIWWDTVEHKY